MDDVVFTAYRAGDERALSRPAIRNGAGDGEPSARVARLSFPGTIDVWGRGTGPARGTPGGSPASIGRRRMLPVAGYCPVREFAGGEMMIADFSQRADAAASEAQMWNVRAQYHEASRG